MNKANITTCLLTTLVICTLFSCKDDGSKDRLETPGNSIYTLPVFPNTSQGQQLKRHILLMSAYGDDAETNYQSSLAVLRRDSAISTTIYSTYLKVKDDQYLLRTLLVETLKEIQSPRNLVTLSEIANSQIPPEKSKNPEQSTRVNEIIIRSTAVEGISALAQKQDSAARRTLLALSDNPELTLRQMAIRGYLASLSQREQRAEIDRLKKKMPQDQHWMITPDTTDIRKVPHPKMPDSFELKTRTPKNTPKIKK